MLLSLCDTTKYIVAYLFQLLGLCILTVGVWAWSEKDIFNNIGKVANIALDPAFILICVGTFTIPLCLPPLLATIATL